jgi:hypothetical protein
MRCWKINAFAEDDSTDMAGSRMKKCLMPNLRHRNFQQIRHAVK